MFAIHEIENEMDWKFNLIPFSVLTVYFVVHSISCDQRAIYAVDYGGRIYIFQSKWLWQLNYWGMESGSPTLARKVFDRPPTNMGAAVYSWRTRYTYFFKGKDFFLVCDGMHPASDVEDEQLIQHSWLCRATQLPEFGFSSEYKDR